MSLRSLWRLRRLRRRRSICPWHRAAQQRDPQLPAALRRRAHPLLRAFPRVRRGQQVRQLALLHQSHRLPLSPSRGERRRRRQVNLMAEPTRPPCNRCRAVAKSSPRDGSCIITTISTRTDRHCADRLTGTIEVQWVVLTCRLSRVTTDVWDPLVEAGNQLARERTSTNDLRCAIDLR